MARYIICPRCELNFIDADTQEYCEVCVKEMSGEKTISDDFDTEEMIEEIKKILSEFKEEKEPTIADILIDYLNSRQEAHSGKSRYYYNKDLAVDLKQVSQIVTFLQQRNITTTDSLWKMIEEVSAVQSRIDTAEEKIKELKKGIKFLGDYEKYKSVADEYAKKKFGRDKFKTEHSKELNSFYRAKRWIDKNPKATTKLLLI